MRLRAAVAIAAGLAAPVWANDTTATIGVGGLEFVQNHNVRMVSEDLYLSMEEVRVVYRFENLTDSDQSVMVAFPMPDMQSDFYSDQGYPTDDPDNIFGFSTLFDGEPVDAQLHQSAFVLGVDRTKDLTRLDIPLTPQAIGTDAALNALDADDLAHLEHIGAVVNWGGEGDNAYYYPAWTLKSAYVWDAVFPAGETVTVEHRYTPGLGGTVATTFLDDDEDYSTRGAYETRYCLDDSFVAAVERNLTDPNDLWSAPYTETWLEYVLSSGANWANSIGTFRLVVDKGDPDNLVSFCGEGVTKTGPTTFEMVHEDFVPWEDIEVLFLVRRPDE
ncbi:DUF4424 domain-containing protein [Pelagibacterium mangrovi]|uniref:DUF4424 domain-containing protein n=1 Tax=Pelagibacterium mangrovi TaxID=3119828 RepID=UPI002FC9742E